MSRPPIVTILGHVDHGKTTLLDAIRKSNIASREAGGITQSIGASKIKTREGDITFIDTPGHAVFSKMRSRGANLADIIILVVAADDGVKPQTKEAITYIKEVKVPFIVALTKTDLPSANIESAKADLEAHEVFFEGRGGETPVIPVSAKKGEGIDDLLEMIHLVAEVSEISAEPKGELHAVVIETNKDKKGLLVSLVVKNGTLKIGDKIVGEKIVAKVKGLFDYQGKSVNEVSPGDPVQMIGFNELPEVGADIRLAGKEQVSPDIVPGKNETKTVNEDQLGIVLKAQSAGSLDAIIENIPENIIVLQSGVGDVTNSDVFFAKSTGSMIVSFEAKTNTSVKKLAETEDVIIESFQIVYKLFERLEEIIKEGKVEIFGKADVLASFPFNKKQVAGCKISEGIIHDKDNLILMRGEKEIGNAKVISMRRGKNSLTQAKVGEECGIILAPQLDFVPGDVLISAQQK